MADETNIADLRAAGMRRRTADLIESQAQRIEELREWVNDLQAGMYINCVYCGHRYGPNDQVPASMADVLKAHVEQCPEHPMSELKAENATLRAERDNLRQFFEAMALDVWNQGDIDGAECQERAVAQGLLVEVPADEAFKAEYDRDTMFTWSWSALAAAKGK